MAEPRGKPLWSACLVACAVLLVGMTFVAPTGLGANQPTPPCPFVPNPPQPSSSGGLQVMSSVVPRILSPCPGNVLFATYLGGSGKEPGGAYYGSGYYIHGVAVDSAGDTYVTGATSSTDFPVTAGAYDTTQGGSDDVFIARVNSTGALVWASYLGGSGDELTYGIAVDGAGSVYVAGTTSSANFPTTPGAFDRRLEGGTDAFVAKLSGDGSTLLYSTLLGGKQGETAYGITVDGSGSAYVTGRTESSTFPVTAGAYDTSYGGSGDVFVTKLNPAGSGLVYSTFLGGKEMDTARGGIALDLSGNAFVAGLTLSDARGRNSFPTTPGAFDPTFGGTRDGFAAKLNAAGSALVYSTYLGGSNDDYVWGLAVDGAGSAYLTGSTYSAGFPTTSGAFDTTFGGISDAFVTKLNAAGSALVYSTFFGGSDITKGFGIAVDSNGIAVFTGVTQSGDLPLTSTAYDTTANGYWEAYLARLEPAGDALNYSSYLGGSDVDYGFGVAVDAGSNAFLIGSTLSPDFPTTPNAHDLTYNGNGDAFVVKFEP